MLGGEFAQRSIVHSAETGVQEIDPLPLFSDRKRGQEGARLCRDEPLPDLMNHREDLSSHPTGIGASMRQAKRIGHPGGKCASSV
jgi:hypothetical protein